MLSRAAVLIITYFIRRFCLTEVIGLRGVGEHFAGCTEFMKIIVSADLL